MPPGQDVVALLRQGAILHEQGKLGEAAAIYQRVLQLDPRNVDALGLLGAVHGQRGAYADAAALIERALQIDPRQPKALNNLGNVLRRLKRTEEALAAFDRALALDPNLASVHNNRGNALRDLGRYDEALASFDRALALGPNVASAHNNRGNALRDLRRYDEAIASLDRAIALNANFADARLNKGFVLLQFGKRAEGWELYEWRWRGGDSRKDLKTPPDLWVPPDRVAGADILLRAEQGIGDEIMFAGLLGDLAREAKSITLECDARLSGLYERSFPHVRLVRRGAPEPIEGGSFDLVMGVCSLGRLYRRRDEDFPRHEGYLKAAPDLVDVWRQRVAALGDGLKVGIAWRGGTAATGAARRSVALEHWAPILEVPGVRFVSLQYGDVSADAAHWGERIAFWPGCHESFDETAALIGALDLVISVQQTAVHLVGALGAPCWGLISDPAEWRYGQSGSAMPWYPSVRLFRQPTPDQWGPVIREVADRLAERARSRDKGSAVG